ncbi:MAG TPA: sulfocyanin-like copper-binding protein [bacterium]|nr:sulfocyanin-like copper-binding protein [bacterium]
MKRIYQFAVVLAGIGALVVLGLPRNGGAAAGSGVAAFSIVAAQTPANGELNYNGTDKGHLVITVPLGATVKLTLSNKGSLPHSLEVIPYTNTLPAQALPTPAFPGAVTHNPQVGITKGQTATIQFTAGKAGKYQFICGFPGHALLGMWGTFQVSPSATAKPSLTVNK